VRNGISEDHAAFICNSVTVRAQQPSITTIEQYQEAWTVCYAAEEVLTSLDDGSEAVAWRTALAHVIFDFEDAYLAKHGHMPLNPAPPEGTDGAQ
jgi:hypothetical protein